MKNYQKFFAVILVIVMVLSVTGCTNAPKSLKEQWSYQSGDTKLPIGVYIYSMCSAYKSAESLAQKAASYDSEKSTYNGEKSFLKIEITDDDGNKAVAEDWIKTEADKMMKNILAIDVLFDELGCTLDESYVTNAKEYASNNWNYGEGINEYGSQYAQYLTPAKDTYEKYGVSEESYFIATSYASIKQSAVFDKLYKKGGSKEVKDSEIENFFLDNYISYSYFSVPLYTSVNSDDGTSTNTPFSDSEIKKYTEKFDFYVKLLNGGASYDEVISKYMKDFNVESDPSTSNTEDKTKLSIGEDLKEDLLNLKEGNAAAKIIGDGDTKTYYLYYKKYIADIKDSYISENTDSLLSAMKNDEFQDYLKDEGEKIDIEINSYVNKYKPSLFEK